MNTADKASPSSVPATPKREVRTVAEGEAIPTAIILGRSKIAWLCCSLTEDHSPRIEHHLCCCGSLNRPPAQKQVLGLWLAALSSYPYRFPRPPAALPPRDIANREFMKSM